MSGENLKFGIFLAPFHCLEENPTLALERDLELISHLDGLNYDYAWIGEHHSAGFEIIASPEIFIAAAAERTRHIKFGTGVSSLPYHHPFMLADRIMQLDHMTRGRVAFGVGPGALPSDAFMLGINPLNQRDMMLEAIEVLVPLLKGEKVSRKGSYFELNEAQLQLQPFTKPMVEMAVASQISPAGASAAGSHGLGLLSIGATSAGGFDALASNWEIYQRKAEENDQQVNRSQWSLVGPMHIAETTQQAFENVQHGLPKWVQYFTEAAALPIAPSGPNPAQALVDSGLAVIGTPDDAIAQIKRLQQASGGFGSFLQMATNWADWQQTKYSYELFARYVAPVFQSTNDNRSQSYQWAANHHDQFSNSVGAAIVKEIQKHETAAKIEKPAKKKKNRPAKPAK
ncbi:MAG: LLM class flavin-dependent oxidoreductase [Pseudomonadales bacterium]|nr:LLM class flavin-dependent oxidoreductase [Pseudomonadales bacterium]